MFYTVTVPWSRLTASKCYIKFRRIGGHILIKDVCKNKCTSGENVNIIFETHIVTSKQ